MHSMHRRFSLQHGVIVFAIVACCALLATYAIQTWHARAVDLRQGRRETTNLARSLSLQVAGSFQTADTVLLGMRQSAESGSIDRSDLRRRLEMSGTARFDGLPIVYALAVLDKNGRSSAQTQSAERKSFRDREYFRYHLTHVSRQIHIGPPVRSKIDGTWIVTATRRLNRPDGSFDGVVEAKLSLRFFEHIFDGMDVGKHGVIALVRDDGMLLARKPSVRSYLGRFVVRGTFFRISQRSATEEVATVRSVLDGETRLTVSRAVEGYPLVTSVAFSSDEMLATWRGEAIVNLVIVSCLVLLIGFVGKYLAGQIEERQALQDGLARLANVDGLTGIANRRDFDVALDRAWRRASRDGTPLALLMIDADHFKAYNDRFGHMEGDDALKNIARRISESAGRPDDHCARYGGEEFAVILPATDSHAAFLVAERIRSAVATTRRDDDERPDVTVSIGAASMCPCDTGTQSELLAAADAALYRAKRRGRDRTETYDAAAADRVSTVSG